VPHHRYGCNGYFRGCSQLLKKAGTEKTPECFYQEAFFHCKNGTTQRYRGIMEPGNLPADLGAPVSRAQPIRVSIGKECRGSAFITAAARAASTPLR
jgi:hypothetical protein